MRVIDKIYIDGAFVAPLGDERFELINPATEELLGVVVLGNREDAILAIAAATTAQKAFARTTKQERAALLNRLHDTVSSHKDALVASMVQEYGAPVTWAKGTAQYAADVFLSTAATLKDYEFTRSIGSTRIVMQPLGVAAMITPWNSDIGFICSKLASAIAAGCTAVIKPSEMSAIQTQTLIEAVDEAQLPKGVFNVVNGRGDVVGDELTKNIAVAKVSFTGSTAVGKSILRNGAETMKRVTLELGGKSPTIVLDDADLSEALTLAIAAGFSNSGQACHAGTRILVPKARYAQAESLARDAVNAMVVGDPNKPATSIGPMVSQKQWARIQDYIKLGTDEGATLVAGGQGRPEGVEKGFFVKPTLFGGVNNSMRIAQEEIFGPVLCLIPYETEEDAITMANDSVYGLQAIVISGDRERAGAVAAKIDAGRVHINAIHNDPQAPFGGFKQSGIGREFGVLGLEAYLEPKAIMGVASN